MPHANEKKPLARNENLVATIKQVYIELRMDWETI